MEQCHHARSLRLHARPSAPCPSPCTLLLPLPPPSPLSHLLLCPRVPSAACPPAPPCSTWRRRSSTTGAGTTTWRRPRPRHTRLGGRGDGCVWAEAEAAPPTSGTQPRSQPRSHPPSPEPRLAHIPVHPCGLHLAFLLLPAPGAEGGPWGRVCGQRRPRLPQVHSPGPVPGPSHHPPNHDYSTRPCSCLWTAFIAPPVPHPWECCGPPHCPAVHTHLLPTTSCQQSPLAHKPTALTYLPPPCTGPYRRPPPPGRLPGLSALPALGQRQHDVVMWRDVGGGGSEEVGGGGCEGRRGVRGNLCVRQRGEARGRSSLRQLRGRCAATEAPTAGSGAWLGAAGAGGCTCLPRGGGG